MSRTKAISYDDRYFWTVDDAFGVWFAYLVEEIVRQNIDDPWFVAAEHHWRVAAAVADYGASVEAGTPAQIDLLVDLAARARRHAVTGGTVSKEQLQAWVILDDLPVAGAICRTGDGTKVELDRILEVADTFDALLQHTLPPDPPGGVWFAATGQGLTVMATRAEQPNRTA